MRTMDNYISIMIDGLSKKILLLNKIIAYTNREKELLLEEFLNMNEFDSNMKEKTELVEQLTTLDNGFTSVFDRVKIELETNKAMYEDQVIQMKSLIKKITELSVKIQSQESRNKELAQKQFATIKKEVKVARLSGQMATNYYKSMSMIDTEPQFIDKKK